MEGLEHATQEDRLTGQDQFGLTKKRLRGEIVAVYDYVIGGQAGTWKIPAIYQEKGFLP